ncbi:hypothetical protein FB451DRAFT_1181414 [Mycena latifolia]|nr:hypothetical protein FB451DRAFT_1181414 [Mycena latifolia]
MTQPLPRHSHITTVSTPFRGSTCPSGIITADDGGGGDRPSEATWREMYGACIRLLTDCLSSLFDLVQGQTRPIRSKGRKVANEDDIFARIVPDLTRNFLGGAFRHFCLWDLHLPEEGKRNRDQQQTCGACSRHFQYTSAVEIFNALRLQLKAFWLGEPPFHAPVLKDDIMEWWMNLERGNSPRSNVIAVNCPFQIHFHKLAFSRCSESEYPES